MLFYRKDSNILLDLTPLTNKKALYTSVAVSLFLTLA